ncbi:MAG: response regulator [Deltaproteobacteria bacterium]|nr:response regulator [Deltaproteobacteria bacterium]
MRHRFATVGSSPTSQRVIDLLGCVAEVIKADDARDAARLLDEQGVTAVLLFADIGSTDGMRAAARVLADTALTAVPVLVVSRPVDLQRRVDALRLGAGAVLDDGADVEAIERVIGEGPEDERVEPLLERSQHGALHRTITLLASFEFTGTVNVTTADDPATLTFERGRVVRAEYGTHTAFTAIDALVGLSSTVLDFSLTTGAESVAEPAAATSGLTVLFIDDDPEVRRLYRAFLARAGFEVIEAEDAATGLAKARALRPDVVVTDLHMPKADGWRVIAELRNDPATADARIILHSAYHELLDELTRIGAGADAYVKKDGKAKKLIEQVLALGRARAHLRAALGGAGPIASTTEEISLGALLHDAARAGLSARVVLDDDDTRVELRLDHGRFASADGWSGDQHWTGRAALARALGMHPARVSVMHAEGAAAPAMPLESLVDEIRAVQVMNEADEQQQCLAHDSALTFDEARLSVYQRQCAPEVRPLISALRAGRTPRSIIATGAFDPVLVDGVVHDIMQRGIARAVDSGYLIDLE